MFLKDDVISDLVEAMGFNTDAEACEYRATYSSMTPIYIKAAFKALHGSGFKIPHGKSKVIFLRFLFEL